jgi:hypothetical protein
MVPPGKGHTYDSVYNLGVYNYQKIPHFLKGGIKVPLYLHTMSLVEIQLWSYFRNNMPMFERNTTLCRRWRRRQRRQRQRLSGGDCSLAAARLQQWQRGGSTAPMAARPRRAAWQRWRQLGGIAATAAAAAAWQQWQ